MNYAIGMLCLICGHICLAETKETVPTFSPPEIGGFFELRGGYRLQNDKYQKDMSVMETRLQLEAATMTDWADFKFKGDALADAVRERGEFDWREGWMFTRPTDWMDIKIGRQILTWGTGDLLFINDLFPKDWESFFIGRDTDYLKAPSDAVKFSFFSDLANLDIVYTPQFDPDRYITGHYTSYWNSRLGRRAGRDAIVDRERPEKWFHDDELAARLYRTFDSVEVALYGYQGFWKSPGGQTADGVALFPDLNVFGASIRGPFAGGIANAETGYYQSKNDESGNDPYVNNSEMRYLVGYTREIVTDFSAGVQYYIEQMLDYNAYLRRHPTPELARDEYRHVVTLRLTQLLMSQNLQLSLFNYYSPSDNDAYLRPNLLYKATDHLTFETGLNIFLGKYPHTFFGQFEDNTNVYAAMRYSF